MKASRSQEAVVDSNMPQVPTQIPRDQRLGLTKDSSQQVIKSPYFDLLILCLPVSESILPCYKVASELFDCKASLFICSMYTLQL